MEKSAVGRLTEVTNGRFVEAKHEEPALSIGQLWRSPTGGYGRVRPTNPLNSLPETCPSSWAAIQPTFV
jgi:hypothetical protein